MNKYLKLEYYNTCDTDDQFYQTEWKQRLWINSDLFKPQYEVLKDGGEVNSGAFLSQAQTWVKSYTLQLGIVPEYLVDALHSMATHDHIRLWRKDGTFIDVYDVEITADWINECYADVALRLIERSVMNACCTNYTLVSEPPLRTVCEKLQWWLEHDYDTTGNAYVILSISGINTPTYIIDWGDGTIETLSTNLVNKTHYYSSQGTYRGYVEYEVGSGQVSQVQVIFGQVVVKDFDLGECWTPTFLRFSTQRCDRVKFYCKDTWTNMTDLVLTCGSLGYGRLETIYNIEALTSLYEFIGNQQSFDINTVNSILIHIDSVGAINQKVLMSDGLGWIAGISELSPAAEAARLSLIGKGYTVTMNA